MKYAVISDIHGNYPALCAVLEDARCEGANKYIFLGDYIFDMPFSNEVCGCVSDFDDAVMISGNKEGYLDWLSREDQSGWTYEQLAVMYQTFLELTDDSKSFISRLKQREYIPTAHGNGNMFASHSLPNMSSKLGSIYACDGDIYEKMEREKYTRRDFLNYYKEFCAMDETRRIAEEIGAGVILAGHNHIQGHAYIGDTLFVNPGSVGIPLDMEHGAAYTLIWETENGFELSERRVDYNIDGLIRAAKKTEIYKRGEIWCRLLFFMLKTGIAVHKKVFDAAWQIATAKGEPTGLYSNETWRETYEIFAAEYGVEELIKNI